MDKITSLLTAITTEPALKALDRIGITPFLCGYGIYQVYEGIKAGVIPGDAGTYTIGGIIVGFFFARFKEREQKATNGGPAATPPTV